MAQWNAAKAKLANARSQLDRGKKLRENNWINPADYDQLVLDTATADAEVVTGKVAVENARIALDDTLVRAPVSGTILSKRVERGQVISSPTQDVGGGTLLMTMADLDKVRVRTRVDETDIGKLVPGMEAHISVASYPGRRFAGSIEKIEPQATVEQNVTLFPVLISLPNEEHLLRPGMNVEARLEVARRTRKCHRPGRQFLGRGGPEWIVRTGSGHHRHHRPRPSRDHQRPCRGGTSCWYCRVRALSRHRSACRTSCVAAAEFRASPRLRSGPRSRRVESHRRDEHRTRRPRVRPARAPERGTGATMFEVLRVAFTSIRGNLFRAALTMLGVIIGVAAVITMLALGTGAQRAVEQQLEKLGANVITVNTWMRFAQGVAREEAVLTTDDAEAIRADARHIAVVAPEQSSRQQVKLGNRNLNLSVIGTTQDHAVVNGFELQAGRTLTTIDDSSRRRVAVLGGEVPEQLQTTADALGGRTILVKSLPFEVVGVYLKKGSVGPSNPDDNVYIPIGTSRYRVTGSDRLQNISVQVEPGIELAQAMVEIERVIRREHGLAPGKDNDFAIIDRKQFLATQQQTTAILSFLLTGIAGVSLVVGGIGIMNIMLVTVTERTREIGIRKALGATRLNILTQFLVESVVLCVLGGLLGILLGIGAARALAKFAGWQTYVTVDLLLLAFGFSAVVAAALCQCCIEGDLDPG